MKRSRAKVAGLRLFEGKTEELKKLMVCVKDRSVGRIDAHVLRHQVHELPKLSGIGIVVFFSLIGHRGLPQWLNPKEF